MMGPPKRAAAVVEAAGAAAVVVVVAGVEEAAAPKAGAGPAGSAPKENVLWAGVEPGTVPAVVLGVTPALVGAPRAGAPPKAKDGVVVEGLSAGA